MGRTLINVANRLPVTLTEQGIVQSSGGLVAALEGLPSDQLQVRWIGWPGAEIATDRQGDVARVLEREHGSMPVFLSAAEAHGHYEGFSNASLWPLLHYMPSRMRYEARWWEPYHTVNRRFADQVLQLAEQGDLVWVHDYQLMLVPQMVKQANPELRVGFFLHTPFPSYEVFRCHPRRLELIRGMLGADQLGFHTFGYMRHFRSAVLRLLGIESEITRIRVAGHEAHLGVYPIGINATRFEQALDSPECAEQQRRLRESIGERKLVLSVERLDYTKGILHRIEAIDLMLAGSKDRDRLKFIFVSVPSREGVEEYRELREEVEARIGRLNGKYATLHDSPIRFIHGSVSFPQLCALYSLADVGLITPLIDGMNLVAKEFIACQRDKPGALVLSEFAGAAEELFHALIVNPYDTEAVAETLRVALDMPVEERLSRMRGMRQRVMSFDAPAWARMFIEDLRIGEPASAGLGAAHRPSSNAEVELVTQRVRDAILEKKSVGLFLDYDGTLREIERMPAMAAPNDEVRRVLDALRRRDNVRVTIISGRTPEDLEAWLGEYPFGLIAEHGASLRRPRAPEWEQLDRNVSYAWKHEIRRLLHGFETTTPGSFVEDKRTSLVWHYRRSDPEFGEWKARELVSQLGVLIANEPVQVRHGKKIVEVTATAVNKGAAVLRATERDRFDLVVVAGDDTTDESMFQLELPNMISIRVGEGESRARLRLLSPAQLRDLLLAAAG